jgi:hypothetical protein
LNLVPNDFFFFEYIKAKLIDIDYTTFEDLKNTIIDICTGNDKNPRHRLEIMERTIQVGYQE